MTARESLTFSTEGAAPKLKRKTVPPFDESKFEPLPEVEINPDDEFHVDESSDGEPLRR